jgi:hypothetical protein
MQTEKKGQDHTFSRLAFFDASLTACLGALFFLLCFWYFDAAYEECERKDM